MPWWLLDYRVWLVAAVVASGGYAAVQRLEKEHVQAEFAQFRADVESEAAKAKVRAAQETARQALAAQGVLSALQTRYDALNARYDGLRKRPGSPGSVPSLSTAAPSLEACPGVTSQPDSNARFLAEIESRVIA